MNFDPRRICAALTDAGVRFVVIGGFAAAIHGSPLPTTDVDIVPARDDENLERLARALRNLHARLRTETGPVETRIDAAFLRAMPFMPNLATDGGDVDLTSNRRVRSETTRGGKHTPSTSRSDPACAFGSHLSTTSSNRNARLDAQRTQARCRTSNRSATRSRVSVPRTTGSSGFHSFMAVRSCPSPSTRPWDPGDL